MENRRIYSLIFNLVLEMVLMHSSEKVKRVMDKGGLFSPSLSALSKMFGCLTHYLIIVKLEAFRNYTLSLIFNHVNNRKQRVKNKIHSLALFKTSPVEFHKVLCWVLCSLTFSLQIFFFFVPLKFQAMLMITRHTQRKTVLKELCKM